MEMNASSESKQYFPPPRQMGFGEFLDTTFSLYRSHFLPLLVITSVYFLSIVIGGSVSFLRFSLSRGNWLTLWIPVLIVIFSISVVVVNGLFFATSHAYVQGKIRADTSLKRGLHRFFPCFFGILIYGLLASIMYSAITLPIIMIFSIPGVPFMGGVMVFILGLLPMLIFLYVSIYFFSHWSFMTAAVLIEGKSMREGMRRRRELARQESARTLWRTIAILLIYFAISFILRCSLGILLGLIGIINLEEWLNSVNTLFFPQFPIFRDSFDLSNVVWYLTNVSVDTITMPIWIIGVTLIYFNQRIRKEGFDIEMMTLRQGV